MVSKQVDKQGRLVLGPRFANRMVLVDDSDESRIVITPAKVVPEREAWLYNNPAALESVLRGIQQARDGKFSITPPDIDADCAERPVKKTRKK